MRGLYTVLLRLSLPLILLKLWRRGRREPGYCQALGERFGRYPPSGPAASSAAPVFWVHAVSVGEARAAAPLVRALQAARPDHRVLVTCTTAAGRETVRQVFGDSVICAWLPYDYPGAVRRFLERFKPRLGVLMETEIWPNLLAACRQRGVPVLLANARMSERSARGYARWGALARPALAAMSRILAQSEADAERLRGLGAPRVEVAGNLKFDAAFDAGHDAALVEAGRLWRAKLGRPVLLLASTREGEEERLLGALPAWDGRLLVLVVPRHPQRFDEVAALAQSRRTRSAEPAPEDRVHLGDTMGEMAFYYGACDVAVIGGSFEPLGGQNLIEALAAGAPVVTGPHMFNFAEAARLAVEAGAALSAPDAAAAVRAALDLMADPARRQRMAAAGRALCERHRGATARHVAACLQLIEAPG